MKFTHKGNFGINIEYEKGDTDTEKRIIEQGVGLLKNILCGIKEARCGEA